MAKATVADLNSLYEAIISSTGSVVSTGDSQDGGLVSALTPDGEQAPIKVSGKRLALPTAERLRSGNWDGKIAFHPMSENVYRGDSKVLNHLKTMMVNKMTMTLSMLMDALIRMAADSDYHDKLTPKQATFLTLVKNVDDKAVHDFGRVLDKVSIKKQHRLASVYIKRSGTLDDAKYARVASVTFPVTEDFDESKLTIFGVKFQSKKNFRAFVTLFEFLLPEYATQHAYSAGSNAMWAPSFHALLNAYAKVMTPLNRVIKLFGKKHLPDVDYLLTDLSFMDDVGDLSHYRDLIPTLTGNEGDEVDGVTEPEATTTPQPQATSPGLQPPQTPATPTQPPQPPVQPEPVPGQHPMSPPPGAASTAPPQGGRPASAVSVFDMGRGTPTPQPAQQPMAPPQQQQPVNWLNPQSNQMPGWNRGGGPRANVQPTQYGQPSPTAPPWGAPPNAFGGTHGNSL